MSDLADRVLAVLCGVADVVRRWRGDLGEPAPQCRDYLGRLVGGERRLGEVRDRAPRLERELEPADVVRAFHDVKTVRCLTECPDDLFVVGVADEDEVVVLARVATRLGVHLGDQRAGRVDDLEIPALGGLLANSRGYTVGCQHHDRVLGDLVDLLDEHRPLGLEVADDVQVVDDLTADIDRRSVERSSARSTISIARSTPAQNDRGRGEDHLVLTAGACPAFEWPPHREQRPERSGAAEHRPALAGVRDGTDDRKRVVRQVAHDPGRFHVDGNSARGGELEPLAGPDISRRRHERPGVDAKAGTAEFGGEKRHAREAERYRRLGVPQLTGYDEVTRVQIRRKTA